MFHPPIHCIRDSQPDSTHWGRDEIDVILQKTFSNAFFLNEIVWISIEISLKFVSNGVFNNIPALVQIMAWHHPGGKPLFEPMVVSLLLHICVTRPQWVNHLWYTSALKPSIPMVFILVVKIVAYYQYPVGCHYEIKYNMVLQTAQHWLGQNINQSLNSQKNPPHILPELWGVSYGDLVGSCPCCNSTTVFSFRLDEPSKHTTMIAQVFGGYLRSQGRYRSQPQAGL